MENIYKSFIKFQSEFQGMKPDAQNPFFKSSYITLDGILETVRPLLAKNGLAVMQEATGTDGAMRVKTKLIHESGEMIETDTLEMKPVKNNDPQAAGSCITYMKRYQLAALLGICESVDDDGNKATYGIDAKSPNKNTKEEKLSEAQLKRMYAIAHSKNVDKANVDSLIMKKYKKKAEQMTKDEYDFICNGYSNMQPQ